MRRGDKIMGFEEFMICVYIKREDRWAKQEGGEAGEMAKGGEVGGGAQIDSDGVGL